MAIRFNHTILPSRDAAASARFMAEVLGLPAPRRAGFFHVVDLADDASIDYAESGVDFQGHHVAFLVDDAEFDAILGRIQERGIAYWADPRKARPGQINHLHGGRGVYFEDPDGNYLECITAPYSK
ncbi:VOC family protein [Hyalangium versicolor]|uniref:VOC family protein n=1 Tax=Hyalangium versicolor TaxID=2861190 RepID=UPI001CC9AF38|nr:VOC family protein [Hyalangium versicolor]